MIFFICLLLVGVLFVLWLMSPLEKRRLSKHERSLRAIAKGTGGEFVEASAGRAGFEVQYPLRGGPARYIERRGGSLGITPHRAEFFVPLDGWSTDGLLLRIRRRGSHGVLTQVFDGLTKTEDALFDERFAIWTNFPDKAVTFLQSDVRLQLMAVNAAVGPMALEFRLLASYFWINVRSHGWRFADLEGFFVQSLGLFKAVLANLREIPALPEAQTPPDPTGIELLGPGEGKGGRCRICGEVLGGKIVACLSCGTPHHEECWAFNGRCAVFACGGTKAKGR